MGELFAAVLRARWCVIGLMLLLETTAFARGVDSRSLPRVGYVVAVFDGDTILLDGGRRVRYLGIDAPEVAHEGEPPDCFGDEAATANRALVLHKQVSLVLDTQTKDPYGRLLAYVFTPDGRCANAEMLRTGHACVFRTRGLGRLKEFLSLQREAVRGRRGMWGACRVEPSASYVGNARSFVFHRARCAFGKKTSHASRRLFDTRWAALEDGYRPARCCKP